MHTWKLRNYLSEEKEAQTLPHLEIKCVFEVELKMDCEFL
jgi:hypothetical protein